MFENYDQKERQKNSTAKQKQVYFIQNGNPQKIIIHTYKRNITYQDICKICQKNWGTTKTKPLRLFSIQGVQYENQDITYIKNKDRIYISKGEDFDSSKNFAEYQIIKSLGEGGFGKVSLAQNLITKQFAAIKVIKVERICGANDIDMIFRQIQNLKALNHPNIVKIYNCYTMKNMQVFVVMQYLEGGQLLTLLRQKKRFQEQQVKCYLRQIISAVGYCHRQNIIHRDLKVQNILFKNKTQPIIKIADFGISGVADQFNKDADTGTLKYMSPEILSGKQKINTPAVDVWACGVILYYLLFGFLPFTGGSSKQIINNICEGKFTFPKEPLISQQCKNLIRKIFEVNPKKRIKINEIQQDDWLKSRSSKLRKQLSLRLQSDYILQNDSVLMQTDFQELKNEKNTQEILEQKFCLVNDKKDQNINKKLRKSLYVSRNTPKNSPIMIPKRLQKQKNQLLQQLEAYQKLQKNRQQKQRNEIPQKRYLGRSIQNKYYCSQQLPSINQLRNMHGSSSRGKNSHQELKISDRNAAKKKNSLIYNWK